jgi:hypothetical protein
MELLWNKPDPLPRRPTKTRMYCSEMKTKHTSYKTGDKPPELWHAVKFFGHFATCDL